MEVLRGRLQQQPVVVAVFSTIGLVGAVGVLIGLLGWALAMQIVVTLLVPSLLVVTFGILARRRIKSTEQAVSAQVANARAATDYLATVAPELTPRCEPTNLRAEALEVAMAYRASAEAIKVAVPDLVLNTDPFALRQILHVLIANAVQHGGERIAVWGRSEAAEIHLAVSDDGPGVVGDLGTPALSSSGVGSGLSLARGLSGLMDGGLCYRRDEVWSTFTLTIPLRPNPANTVHFSIDIEAEAAVL